MPIPDDERFERYLSEFRPVAADPLPVGKRSPAKARFWTYALCAAAAVGIFLVLVSTIQVRRKRAVSPQPKNPAGAVSGQQLANSQPLTLQRANDLLLHAPSFKAALDNVAFERQRGELRQGTRSALDTLSKEDIKL